MKNINIDEMKRIQLNILVDVVKFCERHNLSYFLSGGSMLGAIRHKGFIPWDDDIDINMPRPDYNTFISEYKHEFFSVRSWELDNKFLCTYAKVEDTRTILRENSNLGRDIGINIDIFPVDGLPANEKKIINTVRKMKMLWGLVVCATVKDISRRRLIKKIEIVIMKAFYKLFRIESYLTGKAIREAQKYPFDQSNKVAVLVWGYGIKEVISRTTATNYIKVPFEEYMFNIPKQYDEYLSHLYGDYMQLPPESERVYKHNAVAYWKEDVK